jgi:hypothetical protein
VAASPVATGATTAPALPLARGRLTLVVRTVLCAGPPVAATMLPSRTPGSTGRPSLRLVQSGDVVKETASLLVRNQAGLDGRHHPSRRAELSEECLEREFRSSEGGSEGSGGSRSVAGRTAGGHVEIGVRDRATVGYEGTGHDQDASRQDGGRGRTQHEILRAVQVFRTSGE